MIHQNKAGLSGLLVVATTVSACGGSNDGVSSISPPVAQAPAPSPPSPATPQPPMPPPPAGANALVSDEPFAVLGISHSFISDTNGNFESGGVSKSSVQFRYVASDNKYEMSLPGFEPGQLANTHYSGSYDDTGWLTVTSSVNYLTFGDSATLQKVAITLIRPPGPLNPDVKLTYTGWGYWYPGMGPSGPADDTSNSSNQFVYGIPTALDDVPVIGTASYNARVIGSTISSYSGQPDHIEGSARLVFDFAAGSLSGSMKTVLCPWDCDTDLGTYDFTETVYATGSRSFSGKFIVPGSTADSFFEGAFNGPKAAELMARWKAPYLNPNTNVWGTMYGIWLGKKD